MKSISQRMQQLHKSKKGLTLGDLYPAVLAIVLIGIVLGIGLYVLAQVEANITGGSTEINTTITGLGGLASWIGVIVVVIAAAIVLGVVVSSFGGGRRGV
jgi:type II secretory pathway component PulF|tara:strand:- start:3490 stop:3789 length:300 start_codon:yes stop_codon:yes gene_type:complete